MVHQLGAIATTAVATWAIFKRYEPEKPLPLFLLLGAVPGTLSYFLHDARNGVALNVLSTYASFYLLLSLCVLVYRASPFHPLARFPGPFLHKLSKFRMAWVVYSRDRNLGVDITYFQGLHRQYGPYVRIGPNELSICDADAIHPVLGATGFPKGPFWDGRVPPGTTRSLISERDPAEHLRRRKIWNRAFSSACLNGYEEFVRDRTVQFVEKLETFEGVVDLDQWLSYYTFDVMGDLAFSGGFELMRHGDDHTGVIELMDTAFVKNNITAHVPYTLRYLSMLPAGSTNHKFRNFAATRVETRKKEGSLRKDLFHFLIDEPGLEPTPPPIQELMSDGLLAIVAGSDTTSHVLVNIFYFLMNHSDTYSRLQAEVDEYFPHGVLPHDVGKQSTMPFLNAVINEALRLQPPVPNGAQRSTQKIGPRMIGELFIPAETQVSINTYALQRDPKYFFPHPEDFWPDRWLEHEQQSAAFRNQGKVFVHDTTAFFPFSFGPAMCVGKPLAYMQMRMAVCSIMQRFDFKIIWPADSDGKLDYLIAGRGVLPTQFFVRASEK